MFALLILIGLALSSVSFPAWLWLLAALSLAFD